MKKTRDESQRDDDNLKIICGAGRKVGKRAVENMLADKYNKVRDRTQISADEEDKAHYVFAESDIQDKDVAMEDCEGWGSVKDRASRAAKKMAAVRTA